MAFPIPYKLVSAATTNATNVKATAGKIHAIYASNVLAYLPCRMSNLDCAPSRLFLSASVS